MKAALRHKLARAAAQAAVENVLGGRPPSATRAPGHVHPGRCGRRCFPPAPANPSHPEGVGGTD